MIIDADIGSKTQVNIDAEGIRITQPEGGDTFLAFPQLRRINALVDALGRQAHYQELVERYSTPLFEGIPHFNRGGTA